MTAPAQCSAAAPPFCAESPAKSTHTCGAAKHYGQHEKCTAPSDLQRRCRVCNHTVCDLCEPPHCCSHDDRRRIRKDGYGHFGFCNHADACVDCHGHGGHSTFCLRRRADTANAKSEKKRLVKRDNAIATVDAALAVLPRLRAALTETEINEDVLGRVSSAISIDLLRFTLTLMDTPKSKLPETPCPDELMLF